MSSLTRDDILKLARLARLKLSEGEVTTFTEEISAILQYVEQLQTVDLKDVKPTYQVTGLTNVTRDDVLVDYKTSPSQLLKNAPATADDHFKVKRMVG
jgi:aspartyl-tRNA(Asn)/glutamyl-tRNA(Gln) amidotransferase subunit C